ncbi:MAG TPA: adenylate/guanylate cyclase domain-containing protein [Bryobacteraceae bacterium]|jgi:class 3 adenylate cyclase|nr:adenylate/guanylate cyclase domain-containing protein [Bryobacteraceae bacterium]
MPDRLDNPSADFLERKLATILSADVAEFSRLMGEDEEQTLRIFRGHKQVFESLVAMHRGRIFNTAGDAILAEFGSAVEAVRCATDIQAALRTRNDQLPPSRQVKFRIGINLGDVMVHGQDLLGDGVNVAARLQTAAEPGGICISGSVHDQISNKLSLSFRSLGEMNFKNIQRPVRTFSITDAENSAAPPPTRFGAGGNSAKWIAAGLLLLMLLAGGSYWAYTVNERNNADHAPAIAAKAPPNKTPPQPGRSTELQPVHRGDKPTSPGAAATSAVSAGRFDGTYSGPICYGETQKEPQRCYQAKGTISGSKIVSQWTMGREKKVNMFLDGHVAKSGDLSIEIEMRNQADGARTATIDLTGTLRGGLITASGSFLKGRPATLSWRKDSSTSR